MRPTAQSHATDFTGGVGVGYRFNDYLRFDATWDYRIGPGATRQTTVVCPYGAHRRDPGPTGLPAGYLYSASDTCGGMSEISQYNNTFLANGYVDLGTYSGFTPYVGGGLGFNMNVMSGSLNYYQTANGQPYAANLTPTWRACRMSGSTPTAWPSRRSPNIPFAPQTWSRSISSTAYTFAWALSAGIGFQLNPARPSTSAIATSTPARLRAWSIRRPA